jgi:hypothetical protein
MANAFTNLQAEDFARQVVDAFVAAIAPVRAFASDFSDVAVQKNATVTVPYVGSADAATDFAGSYTIQDADATGVQISINKHKFVSWGLSDTELSTRPSLNMAMFAKQKGFQLAKAVFQDIMSVVTNANYGAAAFTGAATTFDADDVIDIRGVCSAADWPTDMRSLIIDDAYYTALLKDNALQDASAGGSTDPLREGATGRLGGFNVYESTLIPRNSENLVGLAVYPTAIFAAMRYLQPQGGNNYSAAGPMTHESGITLGYREWYDNDSGTMRMVMEANYGYSKGDGAAIKRMVFA